MSTPPFFLTAPLASKCQRAVFAPLLVVLALTGANAVQAATLAPTATVALSPQSILAGATTTVTVTLTNPNNVLLTGVGDTVTVPVGVTPTGAAGTTCGAVQTNNAQSGGTAGIVGGALAANASCTFSFTATATPIGGYAIPTGAPSATGALAGSAGAPVTLMVNQPLGPVMSISVSPPTITLGQNTIMLVTIANPNSVPLTNISYTTNPPPGASFVVSLGTATCTNGGFVGVQSVSAGAYTSNISLMTPNSTCTQTGTLTSTTPGTYSVSPGTPEVDGALPGTVGAPATFTVNPIFAPTSTVSVSPSSIASGGAALATVIYTNPNPVTLTGIAVDIFNSFNLQNTSVGGTCPGTKNSTAFDTTLSGGTLGPGATCTLTYGVTSTHPGNHVISTGKPTATGAINGVPGPSVFLAVKVPQTITMSSPPVIGPVGGTYAPTATASSGLPVVIAIAPASASVCTVNNNVVRFVAAGTCVINANQAGDATFAPAPQVQQLVSTAPSNHTWVSRTGSDANPCTSAAPCLTFQVAHDQTSPSGEINCLNSGDYGQLTIDRSITIKCTGFMASIATISGAGITISAGPTDKIVLDGLDLESFGTAAAGISIGASSKVHVLNTSIRNFTQAGVALNGNNTHLFVDKSFLIGNSTGVLVGGTNNIASLTNSSVRASPAASLNAVASAIIGVETSVINDSPIGIATAPGAQVISVGPSNLLTGAGSFTSSIAYE